jgi:hypothetical protein
VLRLTSIATVVLVALVTTSAQGQAPPLPDGWQEDVTRPGTLFTIRHTETQAGADAVRIQVDPADVDRFRRTLAKKFMAAGLTSTGAEETKIGGRTAYVSRYVKRVLDSEFDVLTIDIYHNGSLLHIAAWMRPTPGFTSDALERDIFVLMETVAN